MEAKEKAKDLVNRLLLIEDPLAKYPMCFDTSKQCALICVDEKIDTLLSIIGSQKHMYSQHEKSTLDDLLEVKEEIEKL